MLARPRTLRSRAWTLAALAAAVYTFGIGPDTVAQDLFRAAAAVFTGVVLALAVTTGLSGFRRAALAAGVTVAVVVAGAAGLGITWLDVHTALAIQLRQAIDAVGTLTELGAAQRTRLEVAAGWMARLYPGLALLGALAGGTLAHALAHAVGPDAPGPSPAPAGDFRFNDHLVWGAVATLGAALLPLGAPWDDLVANLLVVWAGLYLARGIAVTWRMASRWPTGLRVALFLSAVLLLPYAVGAGLVLGLADTWLDIRRVVAPPPGGTTE